MVVRSWQEEEENSPPGDRELYKSCLQIMPMKNSLATATENSVNLAWLFILVSDDLSSLHSVTAAGAAISVFI